MTRTNNAPGVKGGLTGRYVFCPMSNSEHPLIAIQIKRSDKGNLWRECTNCGARVYLKKGGNLPKMNKAEALRLGALIPDEVF